MTTMNPQPMLEEDVHFCEVHTDREATLRCNKCDRWMCTACAVQTPVGYRCRECARRQQDKFFTASRRDDLVVFGICAGLTALAGAIMSALGSWLLIALIVGFPLGGAISEAALRATGRRRGKNTVWYGIVGAVLGGVVGAVVQVYIEFSGYYAEFVEQFAGQELPPEAVAQLQSVAPTLDTILQVVLSDIGLLLFIGAIAAAIYARYKTGKLF